MAKSFGAWLKHQQHRDDPVGDLAQDFMLDLCRQPSRKRPSQWGPRALKWRLYQLGACDEAFQALDQAKAEWKANCFSL